MEIYKVGGAVRDTLLNLPVKDCDWLVVGATVEQMLEAGYQQVGKDFPVFLHPKTKEEYALARTERKSGPGHTGFTVHASPEVTLEEDLFRRDLSINAIAEAVDGSLIDPYHGIKDLKNKLLRHVSPAFTEDPLRVLRVARFAARFNPLGFSVAPATLALMQNIVESGELNSLVPERIWQETSRSLIEDQPAAFFEVLNQCNATDAIYHGTKFGSLSLNALNLSTQCSNKLSVRFAALFFFSHSDQENETPQAIFERLQQFITKIKIPNECAELASLVHRFQKTCDEANSNSAEDLINLLEGTDALRKPERFEDFLKACCAINGATKHKNSVAIDNFQQGKVLQKAIEIANSIEVQNIISTGFTGKEISKELHKQRVSALTKALSKLRH